MDGEKIIKQDRISKEANRQGRLIVKFINALMKARRDARIRAIKEFHNNRH